MQSYLDIYKEFSQTIKDNSAKALNAGRDEAFKAFSTKGFPKKTDEEYLNSRISDCMAIDYGINLKRLSLDIKQGELYQCRVPNINAIMAFMLNDRFYISDKEQTKLPNGVVFCSISEAEKRHPELIKKYFFSISPKEKDSFTLFNDTFSQDGFFLYVPENTEIDTPLQLINIVNGAGVPIINFTHNLIVVEKGARLKLLVCDHTSSQQESFSSRQTEVFLADQSDFEFCKVENTSRKANLIEQIFVNQQNEANAKFNNLSLLNSTSRTQIEADINGERSSLYLGGMLISDGSQETENYTIIRHNAPNSTSNELFKYILDDSSHGIFSGRIVVNQVAQKTESRQTNRNICLTREASMNARPQLEIYADDVKCGHGATTGQLDAEAMFYMKQRGIDEKTARLMLLGAFVQDVIDQIGVEALRERLKIMVEQRLRGENAHCENCSIC